MGCRKWLFLLAGLFAIEVLLVLSIRTFTQNPALVDQNLSTIASYIRLFDWTIVIAVLAVMVSFLALVNDWESTRLNKRMFADLQFEKQQNRLFINVEEAFKDTSEGRKDDVWGLIIRVNNRSPEIPFFKAMQIKLVYTRRTHQFDWSHILYRLIEGEETLTYTLYYGYAGLKILGVNMRVKMMDPYPEFQHDEIAERTIYLVNWETKEPINFGLRTDQVHYKGPVSGEKETWMLYGYLPESWRLDVMESESTDFVLSRICCIISADIGEYELEGNLSDFSYMNEEFRSLLDETAQRLRTQSKAEHPELDHLF